MIEVDYVPIMRRHFGDDLVRLRNLEMVADMICDGHPVYVNFKLDRWLMARYLVKRGRYAHVWPAYLQVLRFMKRLR